jgi:hypothetical protein
MSMKKKKAMPIKTALPYFFSVKTESRHCVKLHGECALLMSRGILVKHSVRDSLIDLLDRQTVCSGCVFLASGSHCLVKLLDCGLQLGTDHLVAKRLCLVDQHTLLRGLDIRHFLTSKILKQRAARGYRDSHLRGDAHRFFRIKPASVFSTMQS